MSLSTGLSTPTKWADGVTSLEDDVGKTSTNDADSGAIKHEEWAQVDKTNG